MFLLGGAYNLPNPPLRRAGMIAGLVAAIFFIGNIASNLIATDLQVAVQPYRLWVWIAGGFALVVAVVIAIVEVHRKEDLAVTPVQAARIVVAGGTRSIATGGKVENSTLVQGDLNFVSKVNGDVVTRDKIINITQAPNLAVNALHQLRPPVGDFVGREPEIKTLIYALRDRSRASITGISGMGGIGKTELALLVAQRFADSYPDAQFFINLQGSDANPRQPQDVMATCIRAFLGPEATLPEDVDELSHLYRSLLSNKHALILLDDAVDSAQVRPLLPPPSCALLVTSRQPIALAGITPLTLNPLRDKEAQALLLEIAPRAETAADQICQLCGYLPLAIRAAGSLLAITADLDPIVYAEQLKDERQRLAHLGSEGVDNSVAASFNLSYTRLTASAARVFRLLSIFPSTFDAAAEEVVCTDSNHSQLSGLLRRSLVLFDEGAKRYRLHDLLRLFAATKLTEEERYDAMRRYATHYVGVLADAEKQYREGGQALRRGLALFDLEWTNIQAGHAWVTTQDIAADEHLARLAMAYPDTGVYLFGLRRPDPHERIQRLEIALAAARQLQNRPNEGATLGNLGLAYTSLGRNPIAIQLYQQALLIFREIGDRKGEGDALASLGRVYGILGQRERAIQFYEWALLILREINERRDEGTVLGNLGNEYLAGGDVERAITFYEKQLNIVREIGDLIGEADVLDQLGVGYALLGEPTRSLGFFEQALATEREMGNQDGERRVLNNLGLTYKLLGNPQRAIELYEQSLAMVQDDDPVDKALALWNMSLALYQLGKRTQAIQHAEQSLMIYEQVQHSSAIEVRETLAKWRAN